MPLQLRRRNGSVTPFRNSEYLPFYYFIPKSILKKCGAELNAIPRNPREIFKSRETCEFIESDLFFLLIIDAAAYLVWPHMGNKEYALSQYSCPKEGGDVPESVIEAFFTKIVVAEDGFHWYIRVTGDPDKPLRCKVEGKRRSTTKIVVTQDFSPALDSSTTGCHQGLRFNPIMNPCGAIHGDFFV